MSENCEIGKNGGKKVRTTFDAFVTTVYLPYAKLRKRSWKIDERIALKRLSPAFGSRRLLAITSNDINDWLQGMLADGLAPASCLRYMAVLKTVFALAKNRGFLNDGPSPCCGVEPLKVYNQRERYLSFGEARSLMERLKQSDRPEAYALRLLLLTGARKSEILKARWEYINESRQTLVVPVSKSGKPRHIVLSKAAMAVLKEMPCQGPWLFPGRGKEKPLSDLFLFWDKIRRELGLDDVRIHDLRHTFASWLVNAGHSLYEVQQMLGHGDPRTTMRYAHLNLSALLAAADAVGVIFSPVLD